jgi:hypothetical protein
MIPYGKMAWYSHRPLFAEELAKQQNSTRSDDRQKMNKKIVLIHAYDSPRKIKVGFYWQAAILPTLWALSEGMISTAGRSFAFDAALTLTGNAAPAGHPLVVLAILLGLLCARNIYFGKKAGSWLQAHLALKGYKILSSQ